MPRLIENSLSLQGLPDFARLTDYFGIWAMWGEMFRSTVRQVSGMDLRLHVERTLQEQFAETYEGETCAAQGRSNGGGRDRFIRMEHNIARFDIEGTMMKFESSFGDGTSTVAVRRALRQAQRDDSIARGILVVDSPGGSVAGTRDLAEDVRRFAEAKPLFIFFEDMAASAGYWAGVHGTKIFATPTTLIGSIGVYGVVDDVSGAFEKEGIKTLLFSTGPFKGAGVLGTVVTEAQQAEFQRIVDALNEHFLAAVMSGRKMDRQTVEKLADGRVHVGEEALALGLVDEIATFEAVLDQLSDRPAQGAGNTRTRRAETMEPDEKQEAPQPQADTPKAASIQDVRSTCQGADDSFVLAQIEAGATLDQAKTVWIAKQQETLGAKEKELEEARAAKPAAGNKPTGSGRKSETDGGYEGETGDPVKDFDLAVRRKIDKGVSRMEAVKAVAKADPELHTAYLLATNPGRQSQEAIQDMAQGRADRQRQR